MTYPRFMIAATSSGSGKTLITCGLLQALKNRDLSVSSFKCGPDYIDPMFHSKILGTRTRNLDPYFTDADTTRYLFAKSAKGADVSVIEGVMGYYDGLDPGSTHSSSHELATILDCPVILVVDAHGMSRSILAVLYGFLHLHPDARIQGVILNRISPGFYPQVKEQIETELQLRVFGYVPVVPDLVIESRHLGLVGPDEVTGYHEKLHTLAVLLEDTVELDGLLKLAGQSVDLAVQAPNSQSMLSSPNTCSSLSNPSSSAVLSPPAALSTSTPATGQTLRVAIARDEAFCFYYEDNLDLLRSMGATLVEFSPLTDSVLPAGIQGLLLGGGYPELYADALSQNRSMKESIRTALINGLPCMAECGGFMYLHETMEDMKGTSHSMVGAVHGHVYRTDRLTRFGYVELTAKGDQMLGDAGTVIKGHEFHYFDSTSPGDGCTATKASGKASWDCIHSSMHLAAGYPHLYYPSNPAVPQNFLTQCRALQRRNL